MQKLNLKYILWKLLIYFLLTLMVLPLSFPAFLIVSKSVQEDGRPLAFTILAFGAFVVFLLYQNWLLRRSDLSAIPAGRYIAGESIAFTFYALLGSALYFLLSHGWSPGEISYANAAFLPFYPFALLTKHIAVGAAAVCAAYALCVYLLYLLKKKSDPSLRGRKGRVQSAPGEETVAEQDYTPEGNAPEGNTLEEDAPEEDADGTPDGEKSDD